MAKHVVSTEAPNTSIIENPIVLDKFIRAKRTSLELRLEDCAALCGIGINTLSRIENGNKNCTLGALFKVLNGLGMKLTFTDINCNSDNSDNSHPPKNHEPWV